MVFHINHKDGGTDSFEIYKYDYNFFVVQRLWTKGDNKIYVGAKKFSTQKEANDYKLFLDTHKEKRNPDNNFTVRNEHILDYHHKSGVKPTLYTVHVKYMIDGDLIEDITYKYSTEDIHERDREIDRLTKYGR